MSRDLYYAIEHGTDPDYPTEICWWIIPRRADFAEAMMRMYNWGPHGEAGWHTSETAHKYADNIMREHFPHVLEEDHMSTLIRGTTL